MATFKDLHIENSKNYKRWYYSSAHWHTNYQGRRFKI